MKEMGKHCRSGKFDVKKVFSIVSTSFQCVVASLPTVESTIMASQTTGEEEFRPTRRSPRAVTYTFARRKMVEGVNY